MKKQVCHKEEEKENTMTTVKQEAQKII